jgi:hypothetical protein
MGANRRWPQWYVDSASLLETKAVNSPFPLAPETPIASALKGTRRGKKKGLAAFAARPSNIGRSGGIRTRDPLLPKQMRYQAALRSDSSYSNPPIPLFLANRLLF